ncbi:MAG: HPr family phosphocarrier protein [Lachnospiraceae bacterium]|nr:HPr family phosphocarrier protein [Lachnospiraceae bacterium]
MVSRKLKIINESGLQMQPAGSLCREAMKFNSFITLEFNGVKANAKSVLSVLGACVGPGDEIELSCEGEDENEALEHLSGVIESGFKIPRVQ